MDEQSNKQEKTGMNVPPEDGKMRLNICFEPSTGKIEVTGHIGNTDLCTKILVESAHIIMVKNADKDTASMHAGAKAMEIIGNSVKRNGQQ